MTAPPDTGAGRDWAGDAATCREWANGYRRTGEASGRFADLRLTKGLSDAVDRRRSTNDLLHAEALNHYALHLTRQGQRAAEVGSADAGVGDE